MTELSIENGIVVTVNNDNTIHPSGYVLIEDDRIAEVNAGSPPPKVRREASETIDAAGFAVMPGITNAHVQLQQTLIRGLPEDRSLVPWFLEIAQPVCLHMTEAEIYPATLMGIVENIRGGATSVTDNLTVRVSPGAFDACLPAGKESGIRYKLARGFNEHTTTPQFFPQNRSCGWPVAGARPHLDCLLRSAALKLAKKLIWFSWDWVRPASHFQR